MTFAELHAALDDLPVSLPKVDRDTLINEGYRELATQSGWSQKTAITDTTVDAGYSYDAPVDLHQAISLCVSPDPTGSDTFYRLELDRERFNEILNGARDPRGAGFFQVIYNDNAPGIRVAPSTQTTGDDLVLTYVYRPAPLSAVDDEPEIPAEYQRGIIDYAKAMAYGIGSDNAELATFYRGRFEQTVASLRRLRTAQTGIEPRDALLMEAQAK